MAFSQNSNQNMMMKEWFIMKQMNQPGTMGSHEYGRKYDTLYDSEWSNDDGKSDYDGYNTLYDSEWAQ